MLALDLGYPIGCPTLALTFNWIAASLLVDWVVRFIVMTKLDLRFWPGYPKSFVIYENDVEVAGVYYRLENALAFAYGENQALELIPEPDNPHGKNAIKVIGAFERNGEWLRVHVGYIPHGYSAQINQGGFTPHVRARLRNIWVSDTNHMVIRFDLIGPKEYKQAYLGFSPQVEEKKGYRPTRVIVDDSDEVTIVRRDGRGRLSVAALVSSPLLIAALVLSPLLICCMVFRFSRDDSPEPATHAKVLIDARESESIRRQREREAADLAEQRRRIEAEKDRRVETGTAAKAAAGQEAKRQAEEKSRLAAEQEKADREAAAKRRAKIEADAKAAKEEADAEAAERMRLREQDAATLLRLAKKLAETDRMGAARDLRALIKKFPDTKAAAEAKKLLEMLN
jgi:hypothetical protein